MITSALLVLVSNSRLKQGVLPQQLTGLMPA